MSVVGILCELTTHNEVGSDRQALCALFFVAWVFVGRVTLRSVGSGGTQIIVLSAKLVNIKINFGQK